MPDDELEKAFDELLKIHVPPGGGGASALNNLHVAALLGKAITRLDRTSSKLAKANLWIAGVLAFIGIVQIILMVKGH